MTRVTALVVAAVLLFAACGDDSDMSDAAADWLDAKVTATRSAVASGDYAQARTLLDEIDASVASLTERDELSTERAATVTAATAEVRNALDGFAPTTTVAPTTTSPPAPADEDGGDEDTDEGEDRNDDDGPGKGRDKKERGDNDD